MYLFQRKVQWINWYQGTVPPISHLRTSKIISLSRFTKNCCRFRYQFTSSKRQTVMNCYRSTVVASNPVGVNGMNSCSSELFGGTEKTRWSWHRSQSVDASLILTMVGIGSIPRWLQYDPNCPEDPDGVPEIQWPYSVRTSQRGRI